MSRCGPTLESILSRPAGAGAAGRCSLGVTPPASAAPPDRGGGVRQVLAPRENRALRKCGKRRGHKAACEAEHEENTRLVSLALLNDRPFGLPPSCSQRTERAERHRGRRGSP